ncbi:hypothetical protein J2X36_000683 [Methylobacterium sp. BE186]|uniref:hypothetical protein n=1 Tax=Methylobacterium sp. BE186 TaxID=2817715 RepID=UPI00285BA825|nr:hypothetical protein [Methylobacterium sp. BE186]MDR7035947.1 hypothetical protein [Methylobacterium sp. BE186]
MILSVASAALMLPHSALAQTLPKLSQQLAGKSLQCGLGSDLYFDPSMRTASVVDWESGLFPIVESQTTIEPSRISSDDVQLFEVVLKTREGETRHRFERRGRIFLRLGDSAGDDECVLADGRAAYVETRFNMIREGICGNDPKPSCEEGLAQTCGPHPDAACVRRVAPGQR